jgi:hypothetical protein
VGCLDGRGRIAAREGELRKPADFTSVNRRLVSQDAFCRKLKMPLVSSSAVSQARVHLKHTAFIELNRQAIVGVCYADDGYERWQGHRLIGVDGSKIALPRTAAIVEHFGGSPANQTSPVIEPTAMASVWDDLLNEIALDSVLAPAKADEGDLALDHLGHSQPGDLIVFDRNYLGYFWLASLLAHQLEFVGRCSRASFPAVQAMFAADAPPSRIVTLTVPQPQRRRVRQAGLPEQITVRLVRLVLSSGEIEVLMTSLLDEVRYPTADFGPLYFQRWGCDIIQNWTRSVCASKFEALAGQLAIDLLKYP